ncbi:hypothetical protein GCM10011512_14960 [Tersicoccus solisilvae]|uniref:Secreted protein n=2 Tax=Tersicoccus solisilvae TaxID=1882339 RepID=A0ABQ1P119_9MICC|nr:hypothetical protein GCM10011512_14960 [Tersicoccus solisilvae]
MATVMAAATLSAGAVVSAAPASAATIPESYAGSTHARCVGATAAGLGYEAAQGNKVKILYYCKKVTGVGYVTRVDITLR